MSEYHDESVFDNIINADNTVELRILAEQVIRSVKAGEKLPDLLTEVQYTAGLAFNDVKRVEGMVQEMLGMDKTADKFHQPNPPRSKNPRICPSCNEDQEMVKERGGIEHQPNNCPMGDNPEKMAELSREAVAPPGREKQVKELKKHKDIDNPYAVSWHSYDESHPKHKPKEEKKKEAQIKTAEDGDDEIDVHVWMENPSTDEMSALFTISVEGRIICKAMPVDAAADSFKSFLEDMDSAYSSVHLEENREASLKEAQIKTAEDGGDSAYDYHQHVDMLAHEALEQIKEGADENDAVHELADSSRWITYTYLVGKVLEYSENEPDGDEVTAMSGEGSDWRKMQQVGAYMALEADIYERLSELRENPQESEESAAPENPDGEGHSASLKTAALKGTLRKLKKQLNSHDHEDVEGMHKLLDLIEKVEKRIKSEDDSRAEKKKKRDEAKPKEEPKIDDGSDSDDEIESLEDEASESDKDAKASRLISAAVNKVAYVEHIKGHRGSDGSLREYVIKSHKDGHIISSFKTEEEAKHQLMEMHAHEASLRIEAAEPGGEPDLGKPDPLSPQAPLPTGQEMSEHRINLKKALNKLEELTAEIEKSLQIPEMQEQASQEEPILVEWLRQLGGKRALLEKAGEKWSLLLVEAKHSVKAAAILKSLEKRLTEEVEEGQEGAERVLRTLKAMMASPKYRTEKKPYVMVDETPEEMQREPHMKVPSEEHQASLRLTAEDEGFLSGLVSELDNLLTPFLESLEDITQNIFDLSDHAEAQLA